MREYLPKTLEDFNNSYMFLIIKIFDINGCNN